MIEIVAPFVLLLMSWEAVDPEGTIEVQQRVFIDQATCRAAAREVERLREPEHGRAFAWRCIPQPMGIEIFRPQDAE